MSLKELQLPSIASLRAIAALKSTHLASVRPARIGLGFESAGANQKSLAEVEAALGGPGRLSLPYSLRWLLDVLSGLGVLHRTLNFVHGELQPEHVVLGDDGIGRLVPVVRAHWARGEERAPERLYYLAPEKLLGDAVDVRADVFSVGVMLWEALTGQRLLEAYTVDDIIARLMGGGIPRAQALEGESWSAPLSAIAERALAIDPARRFGSVAEMKSAIETACHRYVASPPGMAALFQDPQRRARSGVRDSLAPESQRVTVPPDVTAPKEVASSPIASSPIASSPLASSPEQLDAAAERLSRYSMHSSDFEDELTTRTRAPVPVARANSHVNTLLGVPFPSVTTKESSAPDSVTTPFARPPASTAPVVIPTVAPNASQPPPAPLPFGKTRTQFDMAEATRPEERAAAAAPPLATAASKEREPSPVVSEPSFELMRPRKSRAVLWLALGAAAAISLFAARPWLTQQLSPTPSSPLIDAAKANDVREEAAAARATAATSASSLTSARAIGIASTPAAPRSRHGALRSRGADPHIVIDDRLEPNVSHTEPAAPATPPEPEIKEPAPEPPPVVTPPPAPKPKPVPVSDADRYGI